MASVRKQGVMGTAAELFSSVPSLGPQLTEQCSPQLREVFLPYLAQSRNALKERPEACLPDNSRPCQVHNPH